MNIRIIFVIAFLCRILSPQTVCIWLQCNLSKSEKQETPKIKTGKEKSPEQINQRILVVYKIYTARRWELYSCLSFPEPLSFL